jgi:hypothetical protein
VSIAAKVGATIARIHAATAGNADIARRFANDQTFHAIRLEPDLEATAAHHPDLRDHLFRRITERTAGLSCYQVLITT